MKKRTIPRRQTPTTNPIKSSKLTKLLWDSDKIALVMVGGKVDAVIVVAMVVGVDTTYTGDGCEVEVGTHSGLLGTPRSLLQLM